MPPGIYQHKPSQGFQKGHPDYAHNKGRKRTKETIEKYRNNSLELWKNLDYRKNMVEKHKGQKNTLDKHWKIKDTSNMNKDKIGKPSGMLGKYHTEEAKRKNSIAHKGKIPKNSINWKRENHPNWKGGITKIDRIIRGMKEYLQWRSDVFQRDNWACKTCGRNGCYVTAHHLKSFHLIIKQYDIKNVDDARKYKELWDINNGITLCEDCHKLADNYRGRKK